MQSTDGSRSGGRRLKDRLARLLRPANSLFRSPCSSSSSASTFTTTVSTSSSSATTTTSNTALLPRVEPFSSSLDLLRYAPPDHRQRFSSSSRHARRRHLARNAGGDRGGRRLSSNPYGFTTDEEDDSDDTEAFLSARSLVSSDSSGFYASSNSNQLPRSRTSRRRISQRQHHAMRRRRRTAAGCLEACSVLDEGFRPLVTTTAEVPRKGLAVVKRSSDPYGDFRESMVEMIVERQMFGSAELHRLLRTYLSLNSPRLHPVILQAFADVWAVLRGC